MSILHTISLNVNGKEYSLAIEPNRTLLEVLREDLSLPGTKPNCLEGECGCCTVLLDDLAINSCLFLAIRANGKKIQTIEGLSNGSDLHPVQVAFIEHGAIQCGYCTPGFVMSTVALLKENKNPGTEDIERALAGNICRCTGYSNIRDAINAVIEEGETGSE